MTDLDPHVELLARMVLTLRRGKEVAWKDERSSTKFMLRPDRESGEPTLQIQTATLGRHARAKWTVSEYSWCDWTLDDLMDFAYHMRPKEKECLDPLDIKDLDDEVVGAVASLKPGIPLVLAGKEYLLGDRLPREDGAMPVQLFRKTTRGELEKLRNSHDYACDAVTLGLSRARPRIEDQFEEPDNRRPGYSFPSPW
jgi:hypothetical protein